MTRGGLPVPPAWVAALDDRALRRSFGAGAVDRGAAYARAGRVLSVMIEDDGRQVSGEVRGSGRRVYTTVVEDPEGGPASGHCSCPMQVDCKHVAAVVVALRGRPRHLAAPPSSAPRPPPPPAWESSLAALIAPGSAAAGEPLGLQLEPVAGTAREPLRVRLRPVRQGANGRWVRTGASWRDLQSPYAALRPHPEHRAALTALWSAWRARQPAWASSYGETHLHLDAIGPSVWRLLAEAERAGVTLLDAAGGPTVRLADAPASLVADLRREGDEIVVDTLLATADGPFHLVGQPPDGVVLVRDDGLLLAAFDRPLDPAVATLAQAAPLRVPVSDQARLLSRYYPALRRRMEVVSSDGSLALPELRPPRLLLTVRFEPDHLTRLTWQFGYPVGEAVVWVPLTGASDEVARDEDTEYALLESLEPLPDLDGVWAAPRGRRRPLATATLAGIGTARFATDLLPLLQDHDGLDVEVEGTVVPYVEVLEPPLISVSTHDLDTSRDWFGLAVTVTIGGQDVPLAQLLSALAREQGHLVLVSGAWFSLDRPELQTLRRLLAEARQLEDRARPGLRVSPLQVGLWQELVALGVVADQSERWTRTVGGLLSLTELPRPEPPAMLSAELRPYQREGYAWLSLLWDLGLGGVLADDMGLGKTLQTLALVARLLERGAVGGDAGPLLVVAPTSVVGTWVAEAARFCPGLPVVAITETSRRSGVPLADRVQGAAVVVTSYALLRLDADDYLAGQWAGLVLDEAQQVKNHRSKTYAVCRKLATPFTLAITGTPLENSLMDLWSLLSLAAPGLFPDPEQFAETWRRPIESGNHPELLAALRRRIRPLMLRRTKEQVAHDLPPKVEQLLEVPLHPAHRRVYDKHLQRERQRVLGLLDDLPRNRLAVLRSLTLLRQLSLDASLVDEQHAGLASSKVDALAELLREVADEGHRALVFSSFTRFLGRVRQRLDADGLGYCYLDGRTRDRPARISSFREGSDPVFLISLKAGGTGLTLTEADYVFVLDPWWNPAVEAQAVDRAHRIGQTSTVMVYRLVATDTIEQKVVALQQRKRELFASVIDGDGALGGALTAEDIRALLG